MADAERAPAAAAPTTGAVAGHTSFLVYRGGRYAWIALGLCALSTLLYVIHYPV